MTYNTLQLTYLLIVGIAAQVSTIWSTDKPGSNLLSQAVGIYAFWFIQQRYKLGTKTMFNAIAFSIILLDGWGMIGIWTSKFGFHHEWEVWVSSFSLVFLSLHREDSVPGRAYNNNLLSFTKPSTVSWSAPGTVTRKLWYPKWLLEATNISFLVCSALSEKHPHSLDQLSPALSSMPRLPEIHRCHFTSCSHWACWVSWSCSWVWIWRRAG